MVVVMCPPISISSCVGCSHVPPTHPISISSCVVVVMCPPPPIHVHPTSSLFCHLCNGNCGEGQQQCQLELINTDKGRLMYTIGLQVVYWLKHWTVDRKVQGSSPTCSRDLFLFWVRSALPNKLTRKFTFISSFGGDMKPSIPGKPLN